MAALTALAGAPLGACAVALRPAWRVGLRERLGAIEARADAPIWIHAASAGEATGASRITAELEARGEAPFLSTTTVAGRDRLRAEFAELSVALAPLDHPWCVDAALDRVNPKLLLLLETELWPVWIAATERRGIPVIVLSARLSDRSFPRYRRAHSMFAPTLRRLAAVGARTDLDAERFRVLGVPADRVSVTGDLKLEPPSSAAKLAPELERVLGSRPLLVAGSTHAGEEEAALAALAAAESAGLELDLVIAPRHLGRVPAILRELERAGRKVRLRSQTQAEPLRAGELLLLDSLGELRGVYAQASLAFVGGTLAPIGGHNLLEPLHVGCPIVFGPHVENVREAAALLQRSGAGVSVADASAVSEQVVSLLRDPSGARVRVAAGQAEIERHRGSVDRSLALVDRTLRAAALPKAS